MMIKTLSSVIVLCLFYDVASQGVATCSNNGARGVCTPLRNCQSVSEIPKSEWGKISRCGFDGVDVIICCVGTFTTTSVRPVATTPRLGTTTTEFVPPSYDYISIEPIVDRCADLAANVTTQKTGRKAWDKCIDYQNELVYPCERAALSRNMGRVSRCSHDTDESVGVDHQIVGSINAKRDEFPHMVLLGYGQVNGTAGEWVCSGTLLSDRFIVTAGNCVSSRNFGPVSYAKTGILKRTEDVSVTQVHRIRRIIRHPQYKPPALYHNIALLEIEDPIKLDYMTVPACLDVFGEDHSKATGPGWWSFAGSKADDLQKVILRKIKGEECQAKIQPNRKLRNGFDPVTQVCYAYNYVQVGQKCWDGAGTSLFIQNRQVSCMYTIVGVFSFGKGCPTVTNPDVYTKVSHYIDWIESIVFA